MVCSGDSLQSSGEYKGEQNAKTVPSLVFGKRALILNEVLYGFHMVGALCMPAFVMLQWFSHKTIQSQKHVVKSPNEQISDHCLLNYYLKTLRQKIFFKYSAFKF